MRAHDLRSLFLALPLLLAHVESVTFGFASWSKQVKLVCPRTWQVTFIANRSLGSIYVIVLSSHCKPRLLYERGETIEFLEVFQSSPTYQISK